MRLERGDNLNLGTLRLHAAEILMDVAGVSGGLAPRSGSEVCVRVMESNDQGKKTTDEPKRQERTHQNFL